MMFSSYIGRYRTAPYTELIKARDRLISNIRKFEKNETAGVRSSFERTYCPRPDAEYQMNLVYLAEICRLMQERYRAEYVWDNRTLKQDAEQKEGKQQGFESLNLFRKKNVLL